jgi:hypothetical protein
MDLCGWRKKEGKNIIQGPKIIIDGKKKTNKNVTSIYGSHTHTHTHTQRQQHIHRLTHSHTNTHTDKAHTHPLSHI